VSGKDGVINGCLQVEQRFHTFLIRASDSFSEEYEGSPRAPQSFMSGGRDNVGEVKRRRDQVCGDES